MLIHKPLNFALEDPNCYYVSATFIEICVLHVVWQIPRMVLKLQTQVQHWPHAQADGCRRVPVGVDEVRRSAGETCLRSE